MANRNDKFFQRLTRIFSSGPSVMRRVKGYDYRSYYDNDLIRGNYGYRAPFPFGRENSPFSTLGAYGILDRTARYSEFAEMETEPIIAAALNVWSDEVAAGDERGNALHLYSKNPEIKKNLEELFFDVLNVDFNLRSWARNLVKYGDFFLYLEVIPDIGIVNVQPIPVNEMEREEGFDANDPYSVRFKWLTRGNRYLENWQILHMRILGNDLLLPYGVSLLEPARRVWRQLQLMEDAMLVYRVERSPERRVFYIDVGSVAPNDVPSYMEAVKSTLKSRNIVDKTTGRLDQRHNPLSMLEDFYIPVRGAQTGTKIETLAGATNATATEDVEYLQKKLFSAIQVPKAYLNYVENMGAKASLSQLDIRFSRTISVLQRIVIAELNKLAMIHLYAKGFDGEDLINFELKLSNPSTVALQQKLEVMSTKIDIAAKAKESGLVDQEWVQKKILELTQEEVARIEIGKRKDKIRDVELEAVAVAENLPDPKTNVDSFDPSNYDIPGSNVARNPSTDSVQNNVSDFDKIAPILAIQKQQMKSNNPTVSKVKLGNESESENTYRVKDSDGNYLPISASPFISSARRNNDRRVGAGGRDNMNLPDFKSMVSGTDKYTKDVFGKTDLNLKRSLTEVLEDLDENDIDSDNILEKVFSSPTRMPGEIKNILASFDKKFGKTNKKNNVLLLNEETEQNDGSVDNIDLEIIDAELKAEPVIAKSDDSDLPLNMLTEQSKSINLENITFERDESKLPDDIAIAKSLKELVEDN